jgi:hypothetical protein
MHRFVAVATLVLVATGPVHAGVIAHRKARQQARIAAGEASGRLSPREAGRLEKQEAAIDHEEAAMRATNGGRLTLGERRVIAHQQNRVSRHIYRQKHDGNDN